MNCYFKRHHHMEDLNDVLKFQLRRLLIVLLVSVRKKYQSLNLMLTTVKVQLFFDRKVSSESRSENHKTYIHKSGY